MVLTKAKPKAKSKPKALPGPLRPVVEAPDPRPLPALPSPPVVAEELPAPVPMPEPPPVAPEPVVEPPRTVWGVRQLLEASFAMHKRARGGREGRPKDYMMHLREAADLRRQAAALDPGFQDEAWAHEDRHTGPSHNTHSVLMSFYESKGL